MALLPFCVLAALAGAARASTDASTFAPPPPPDPALDCDMRGVVLDTAVARLPWSADAGARVHDALRLGECPGRERPAVVGVAAASPLPAPAAGELLVHVDAAAGDDGNDGLRVGAPLRTLHAARARVRAARAASGSAAQHATVLVAGVHYLASPLILSDALDAHTTWRAVAGAVVSGGFPLPGLTWAPSSVYPPPVLEAALPDGAPLEGYALFDGNTGRRLPLAREPNGDAETQMQPIGWALARGNVNGSLQPPAASSPALHVEVSVPARNSSVFPIFGRDFDPRNPPLGYVWFTQGGGAAAWFAGNRSFWNKTIEGGLRWNATGGVDPHSGLPANGFNATTWARSQPGRRAHVFHNALWGGWVYDVDSVDAGSETMTFARGGWQEARGGGIGTQPFFIEGAAEALDAPGEWWVDRARGVLHLWPNASSAGPTLLVAPVLETLITIGADTPGIALEGLTFLHTTDALMEPYTVPAAGDWSIRSSAAVIIDGAHGTRVTNCSWRRVGGHALLVTGAATDTVVDAADVLLPGGCGVAVIGFIPHANASDPAAAFPSGVTITRSLFEGIGVHGKQTSALFVSLACGVTLTDSVLFSGPRSGVNLNDGHCGGHVIQRNVVFDWVRETQGEARGE